MIQHTYTLNKSNQFYISKTSYDNLLSIHQHVFLVMAKSYYTCTCIKSNKEFACCVWKHSKSAYVSHIMMIWDMRKSHTLTHNHNCLMGTIIFEVHPITLTSPINTLATIFKSILILFTFDFFAYSFSFWAYHAWAYKREKRNT